MVLLLFQLNLDQILTFKVEIAQLLNKKPTKTITKIGINLHTNFSVEQRFLQALYLNYRDIGYILYP